MPLSIYLHIPFCTSRCGYCDFNTYAGLEGMIPEYVEVLTREAAMAGAALGDDTRVHTVYFGGGTPSLLDAEHVAAVLRALAATYRLDPHAEVTLEANPGTVDEARLAGFRSVGVNRLSMGAQSARPVELTLLDRSHSPGDVENAVRWARRAGYGSVSIDLIYGLPGQTLEAWEESLAWGAGLGVDHLSLYSLTLEKGTPLARQVARGILPEPDPDVAADMMSLAAETLDGMGYIRYEISNWARQGRAAAGESPEFACRHNLQYWRNQPYLGLGAGAHGCVRGWRYRNVLSPRAYIERIRNPRAARPGFAPAAGDAHRLDRVEEMDETMLLGLRLTSEGITPSGFQRRYGEDPRERYGSRLQEFTLNGLLESAPDRIRLTPRGRMLGNQVFQAFV